MAGAGSKLFTSGSVLTASDVNTYLMDQTIMKFTSTTTRDAAFGGAGEPTLSEGMFAYTTDTNTLWLYDGSNWVNVLGSDIGNQALSNRNVIINGAMQVAQRGTSTASITTGGYYTADRFNFSLGTMGTWTNSIEADAPTGSGLRNSLKVLCTAADASPAASDYLLIETKLEGQNVQQFLKGTASAKQFAVSFWVKSNTTGTYILELQDINNGRQVSASYSVSASGTWEKKTIVFPADTTGAFTNDNGNSLQVNFFLGLGSNFTSGTLNTSWATTVNANRGVGQTNLASATNNYWQVTGVQLEAGAVATPFEFEDIGTTLAKCQRYYQTVKSDTSGFTYFANGTVNTATEVIFALPLRVTMRTTPSLSVSAAADFILSSGSSAVNSFTTGGGGSANMMVFFTTTTGASFTANTSRALLANNNATAELRASSEL